MTQPTSQTTASQTPAPQTPATRHAELEALLTQAQAAYHDQSAPILTDDA